MFIVLNIVNINTFVSLFLVSKSDIYNQPLLKVNVII